jgi:hypothetical protein
MFFIWIDSGQVCTSSEIVHGWPAGGMLMTSGMI